MHQGREYLLHLHWGRLQQFINSRWQTERRFLRRKESLQPLQAAVLHMEQTELTVPGKQRWAVRRYNVTVLTLSD
jgi:hypothetical protein